MAGAPLIEEHLRALEGMRLRAIPMLSPMMDVLRPLKEADDPGLRDQINEVLSSHDRIAVKLGTGAWRENNILSDLQELSQLVRDLQALLGDLGAMCDLIVQDSAVSQNMRRLNKRLGADAHLLDTLAKVCAAYPAYVTRVCAMANRVLGMGSDTVLRDPSYGAARGGSSVGSAQRKRSLCRQSLSCYRL
jgi:hypothetical protein